MRLSKRSQKKVDDAVRNHRELIHTVTRSMNDDEYMEFLDCVGADIDGAIEAKKEEEGNENLP